jgi:transposase, IS5 family
MLGDRDEPMDLSDLVAALGMTIDPVLMQLETLLDNDTLFRAGQADLAGRWPRPPIDGRPSMPVEVTLRMLVVKHVYGWSYEATERWTSTSLVLRQCCRVYAEVVPDATTLIHWANLSQPALLHRLLDHGVTRVQALKVTRGRKLQIDGTGAETNGHPPPVRRPGRQSGGGRPTAAGSGPSCAPVQRPPTAAHRRSGRSYDCARAGRRSARR